MSYRRKKELILSIITIVKIVALAAACGSPKDNSPKSKAPEAVPTGPTAADPGPGPAAAPDPRIFGTWRMLDGYMPIYFTFTETEWSYRIATIAEDHIKIGKPHNHRASYFGNTAIVNAWKEPLDADGQAFWIDSTIITFKFKDFMRAIIIRQDGTLLGEFERVIAIE